MLPTNILLFSEKSVSAAASETECENLGWHLNIKGKAEYKILERKSLKSKRFANAFDNDDKLTKPAYFDSIFASI